MSIKLVAPIKQVGAEDAVIYNPQTLTDEQKAQARENIGAVDKGYVNEHGGTQPDWANNDSASKSFIKNRFGGYYEINTNTLLAKGNSIASSHVRYVYKETGVSNIPEDTVVGIIGKYTDGREFNGACLMSDVLAHSGNNNSINPFEFTLSTYDSKSYSISTTTVAEIKVYAGEAVPMREELVPQVKDGSAGIVSLVQRIDTFDTKKHKSIVYLKDTNEIYSLRECILLDTLENYTDILGTVGDSYVILNYSDTANSFLGADREMFPIKVMITSMTYGSSMPTFTLLLEDMIGEKFRLEVAPNGALKSKEIIFAWDSSLFLPPVSVDDNGKILKVVNGIWTAVDA